MSEEVVIPKGRAWASQAASERAAKRASQKAAGANAKVGFARGREVERANVASEPNKKRRVIIPLPRIKAPVAEAASSAADLEKKRNEAPDAMALFSEDKFLSLGLNEKLVKTLQQRLDVSTPTLIQSLCIPPLLAGQDVLAKSPTGSGKTLAFLLPLVHQLVSLETRITRQQGTFGLILVPTRELALQISSVLERLLQPFHWIVSGSLMGGEKKKSEKARLRKGISVLVATPGRLLDHLQTTQSFRVASLCFFVMDEADRLLDLGFENDVNAIIDLLNDRCKRNPQKRQCALLSATLPTKLHKLSERLLHDPKRIDASKTSGVSTVEADEEDSVQLPSTLAQGFIRVPQKQRVSALAAFLRLKAQECERGDLKAVVFVSTCDEVEFLRMLFSKAFWPPRQSHYRTIEDSDDEADADDSDVEQNAFVDMAVFHLHGNMSQADRSSVYRRFCATKGGLLLSTDVAARGLDLPAVDWIVQFDPPSDVAEYVHRVGRTARLGRRGRALLVLSDSEAKFVEVLKARRIQLKQLLLRQLMTGMRWTARDRTVDTAIVAHFCSLVEADSKLKEAAERAFVSYTRSYSTYPKALKKVFHVQNLHLGHVATAFGLREKPSRVGHSESARPSVKQKRWEAKQVHQKRKQTKKEITKRITVSEFAAC